MRWLGQLASKLVPDGRTETTPPHPRSSPASFGSRRDRHVAAKVARCASQGLTRVQMAEGGAVCLMVVGVREGGLWTAKVGCLKPGATCSSWMFLTRGWACLLVQMAHVVWHLAANLSLEFVRVVGVAGVNVGCSIRYQMVLVERYPFMEVLAFPIAACATVRNYGVQLTTEVRRVLPSPTLLLEVVVGCSRSKTIRLG